MIFVGMDVHTRNSYLHATDGDGHLLKRGRCPNEGFALSAFLSELGAGPIRVSLESTTNSRAIQRLLEQYGRLAGVDLTAAVLDARKLRVIAESVTKCDRTDAAVLAALTRANLKLPVCYIPDDAVFALREHLRARHELVRMRTMLKNRIHAALHRRGILPPSAGLFTVAGRGFLRELTLDAAGRHLVDGFLAGLDQLDTLIGEATAVLRGLARSDRWAQPAWLLQTMPGLGLITALTILAELGDVHRFARRASVANYAGLVPVVRDSAAKQYRGGITHRGPAHLRAVLAEAAWVALPRVPRYQALYDRVAYRACKAVAIVAVARRMLEDSWTMLVTDQPFRYGSVPTASSVAG